MKFKVKAKGKEGEAYEEEIEAADRFAIYRDIRARGDELISVTELSETQRTLAVIDDFLQGVSLDEKVVLTRNLAAMLDAGLTISRALSVMERQTKNKKLKHVLTSLIGEIKQGNTFSSALGKFPNIFSKLMTSMARAGEESGKLSESLRVVGVQMERASNLTKKVRGALIYPSIVISAMIGIGILMLMFVVPTLTKTFEELGGELPPTTQAIINVSNFLTNHTILALTLMVLFVVGFIAVMRTKDGKKAANWLFLRIPLINGLVMETNAARATRTLSSLLSAGVDMLISISITKDVLDNYYYQQVFVEAEQTVEKGGQLSAAFEKHPELFPPLVGEMVAVGEETGRLSDLLKDTAQFYEDSVERQTKDLSTIIEPFLMLIIGAGVGFFALAMIAPIYSLSSAI